jgi:hypothetical protein
MQFKTVKKSLWTKHALKIKILIAAAEKEAV